MARPPLSLRIRPLDALDPEEAAQADALLAEAESALVRPDELLEPISERSLDPARILLVALGPDGAMLGLIDAVPHHPEPGLLTIAAIVVRSPCRRGGTARALVQAAAAQMEAQAGPLSGLGAGVHQENWAALAFFRALGLVEVEARAGVVWLEGPPGLA
jgi:ribosomal protein S18 acetylase RimI-like enzyme